MIEFYTNKVTEIDQRIEELQRMRHYMLEKLTLLQQGIMPDVTDLLIPDGSGTQV